MQNYKYIWKFQFKKKIKIIKNYKILDLKHKILNFSALLNKSMNHPKRKAFEVNDIKLTKKCLSKTI